MQPHPHPAHKERPFLPGLLKPGRDRPFSVAEAVWQECRTSRSRDVCSTAEAHRCKDGRHPERSSHLSDQTIAVLSWLWHLLQEAALAALASVPVWHWARPA